MKATKLVTIFENKGVLNEMILEQVIQNNSGGVQCRLPKIKRFGEHAIKLGLAPPTTFEMNAEGNIMTVKEDGETTVIIEEKTFVVKKSPTT